MIDKKQLFQVQNILETLIEATDHFSSLIKEKKLNQSIYIFSSIVEGSQAVINILNTQDERFHSQTKKLIKYLGYISKEIEQAQLLKVSEIIQFSLRPLLVKLNESFIEHSGNQKTNKPISIGIFHDRFNPKELYTKERLQATLNEGEKQNTKLYFFTSTDINFEKKQINADIFQNGEWERVTSSFPDVINNIGGGKRAQAARKLQRVVPFTSFHVGNKFSLPKRMLQQRKFAELLVPFTVCISEDKVYEFIQKNNDVVFKALGSNRGENIYFVTKKGSRFVMLDQTKERILSEEEFQHFVEYTILAEVGSYIIQRYIHTRTIADEPYHFRSHVQKDQNGEWQITHIYPRIGSKKSNLSNIATEGRVEDFPTFLRNEFGVKQGAIYENKILKLSIDVTKHLDKLYGLGLNELGLDFAIDDTGKIWMHEANNGPQTAYHEGKRAINFISYAKYIARNGIMHIGQDSIDAAAKGQFQARNTNLPPFDYGAQTCIGMLIGKQTSDNLSISLATSAIKNNVPFYSFTPSDIDYDFSLIRGSFYENGEWVQRVTEYPSVIIDRLKIRSTTETRIIYEELEDVPFTNEWVNDATSRSAVYELIKENDQVARSLADYQIVYRPLHVFQFIEQYGQVQLKQQDMAYGNPVYIIREIEDGRYEVFRGSSIKKYSKNDLRNYINHLIEEKSYIVQQHTGLSEIQSMVIKNKNNEWETISNYVNLQTIKAADNTIKLSEQTLESFVKENELTEDIKEQIEERTINVLLDLEQKINQKISEVAMTYVIGEDKSLLLTDVNPNGPRKIYDNEAYAEAMVKYAIKLGTDNEN
ncbi:YheC/YheD family protein [Pseudogracilibacillus sp. SE30717A]|uniref:YheC/YheD family protein n=1 Tax=Pseudogracilibacillus sp. SE30717A TaxID=3098293 RepID=UPI00300DDC63